MGQIFEKGVIASCSSKFDLNQSKAKESASLLRFSHFGKKCLLEWRLPLVELGLFELPNGFLQVGDGHVQRGQLLGDVT